MRKQIVIEIPASIPRILTPNRSRVAHWGQITRAKNEFQHTAFYAAVDAKNKWLIEHPYSLLPFEKGLLWFELVIRDKRSIMDDDNAIAGLKAVRDILQADRAGIIANDRDFQTARLTWTVDKARAPLIILTVEKGD